MKLLIIGSVVAVLFWVVSIVDCAVQPAVRHRGVPKWAWVLIVVLIPVIGGVLWFTIGRYPAGQVDIPRPVAPDDDPVFLRGMSRSEQDERIRRLEEELARLDDETDPPASGSRP